MLRTLVYYVSDYGYGHATRSIAVIRRLADRLCEEERERFRLVVCAGRTLPFLRAALSTLPMPTTFRAVESDLGYVLKDGSLDWDLLRFRSDYTRYAADLPRRMEAERAFLRDCGAQLVVSDISPVPFPAARSEGILSVGLSNFTWFTAYRQVLSEEELRPLQDAYVQMDAFLPLAGAEGEPLWGRQRQRLPTIGFFARQADRREAERLRQELDPAGNKLVVYFPIGLQIAMGEAASHPLWELEGCLFIVSENMPVEQGRAQLVRMGRDVIESQLYCAVSDVVVTKPGWGTVGEALSYGKPLFLFQRSGFPEDEATLTAARASAARIWLLSWGELDALQERLAALVKAGYRAPPLKEEAIGSLDLAAGQLLRVWRQGTT